MAEANNVRLVVAYDGTQYQGWQDNKSAPSIEACLRGVLEQIQQHAVALQAASRTDAGVHAVGQVVNFKTTTLRKTPATLVLSCNALLPPDIRVRQAELAGSSFHPTLDVSSKEYHYWICQGPVQLPHHRWTSWHYPYALDYTIMEQACTLLAGRHDFAAFCPQQKAAYYASTERFLAALSVHPTEDQRLCIRLRGEHFLYKMARTLVGTLLAVGRHQIGLEELTSLQQQGQRASAGVTAPPHGLTLYRVFY